MTTDRKKNPSSIFYWNDLENDEHLKNCSWGARGLWACKLLAIAARSPNYGVIIIGDHPTRWDQDLPVLLAKESGAPTPEIVAMIADGFRALLTELVTNKAASVDEDGRLYNRRMVREEGIRRARSEAGKRGAEATNEKRQKSGKHLGKADGEGVGKEGGKTEGAQSAPSDRKLRDFPDGSATEPRQNAGKDAGDHASKTTPSSLSSLLHDSKTLSNGESLAETSGARSDGAAPPEPARRASRLPSDWQPSDELRQWTIATIRDAGSGVSAGHEVLKFRDYWQARPGAKGLKLDWDATWRNWIRKAIEMEGKGNGTQRTSQTSRPGRSSAVRTAANFAAALCGAGSGGPDRDGWGTDAERLEATDPHHPAGTDHGGE